MKSESQESLDQCSCVQVRRVLTHRHHVGFAAGQNELRELQFAGLMLFPSILRLMDDARGARQSYSLYRAHLPDSR
jgi:hypothetical protein